MKRLILSISALGFAFTIQAQGDFKKNVKVTNVVQETGFKASEIFYKQGETTNYGNILLKTGGVPTNYKVRKTAEGYFWIELNMELQVNRTVPNVPNADKKAVEDFIASLNPGLFGTNELVYSLGKDETVKEVMYRCQQTYKGLPVINATAVAHVNGGKVSAFIGSIAPVLLDDVQPLLSQKMAIDLASKEIDARGLKRAKLNPLLNYEERNELGIYKDEKGNYVLAYAMELRPNNMQDIHVVVDAKTGAILYFHDHTCEINGPKIKNAADLNGTTRAVGTYEFNGVDYLIDGSKSSFSLAGSSLPNNPVGALWTINGNNTYLDNLTHCSSADGSINRPDAISSHYNASKCFDYFKNVHGRNGIDGNGGTIMSVINVSDNNGNSMDNAFWNGQLMAYGNGATVFKPLAGSLDVGGHEMTHGVVQKTANLVYQSQSGALNESFADIFGCMIDNDDWKLGEDIVQPGKFPKNALRDLSDPHNGATSLGQSGFQPRTMREYYTGTQDNQGVHINSGIPNWAYYKFATAVTSTVAEKIYYRALSLYLTSTSTFLDCRFAVIKAATDLHGSSSSIVSAAKKAFDDVEIFDPNPSNGGGSGGGSTGDGTFDLPTNTGTELILLNNTDLSISNTLYLYNPIANSFTNISTTKNSHMPSVVDNGSKAIFTDDQNNIVDIKLTAPYTETIMSASKVWRRAAYSKDGTKIAAISTNSDTSIYVFNMAVSPITVKKFKLYNPTYSSGVNSGGVLYADVIEWDHAGENLIYDALSEVKLSTGGTKQYWDIGLINVWDREAGGFGTGQVRKLFNQLDEGVSIGNPSFSRNSPHIIAFDYIDAGNSTYAAIGMNLSSTKNSVIAINNVPCVPVYYFTDAYLLYTDQTIDEDIYFQELDGNKISAKTGEVSTKFIQEAKWGYSFTNGTRRLLNNENSLLTFSFPGLNPAVEGVFTGTNVKLTVPNGTDVSSIIPTFTNSAASKVSVSNTNQTSGVSDQNFANPKVYKVTAQDGTFKNYTVSVTVLASTKQTKTTIDLYPNPGKGLFNINIKQASFEIFDMAGKKLMNGNTKNGTIDASALNAGNYILNVHLQDGGKASSLIIIEK